ncbi:MAG: hypothetical protein WCT24_03020 [Patescibacteria group bacterium]
MKVREALERLQLGNSIAVNDKTFEPTETSEVHLETGETIYWVRDGGELWLAIDPESDEVILFSDIEDDLNSGSDVVLYGGEEYEFSYEAQGHLTGEDGDREQVTIREFVNAEGNAIRAIEYAMTGEIVMAFGRKVHEDELQDA